MPSTKPSIKTPAMRPLPAFSRYAARDPHKPIASMLKGASRVGIGEVASVELHTGLKAGTTEFRTLGLAEHGPRVVVFHARSRSQCPGGSGPLRASLIFDRPQDRRNPGISSAPEAIFNSPV